MPAKNSAKLLVEAEFGTGQYYTHSEGYLKSVDANKAFFHYAGVAKTRTAIAFGRCLRSIRVAKGFTQEGLASQVGLDRSYVGSVERGERNISLENIAKLAASLRVPITELVDFKKPEQI